mgnify:FL=1
MNTNKKAPKLRFKGFTDDWEQHKLSEITARVTRKNGSQSDLPLTISAQDGLVDQRKYFNRQVASRDMSNYYLIKKGEFAYNKSYSEGYPFGAVKRLDYYDMGALSTLYILFEITDKNISSDFIVSYYMTHLWHKEISKQAAEGARNHGLLNISTEDFFDSELNIPNSIEEQVKIGNFIKQFDKFINLYQRKLDKMKLNKRVLLQKLFPQNGCTIPEVRFKGFTDAWEQRKFGEIMTFLNGRAYKQDELLGDGKYKVLRVGNFYTNDSWYYSNLELDDKFYATNGDLLYTWSATFGPHIWKGEKVIYHYHIWKLVLQDKIDKLFALQLLEVDKANIMSDKNGSTMVHITKQGMENKQTILPISLNEQKQIAKFLSSMDKLITLHQRKLDHLQLQKKALLQQMFV